jgi:ELWxxDGT repeat protein
MTASLRATVLNVSAALVLLSWSSAAAADPAYLVKDITTDVSLHRSSTPAESVTLNGIAYFTADDGVNGRGLWRSDGTTAGTYLVAAPGLVEHLSAAAGGLWFTSVDSTVGCAVWRSDGTAAGTSLVRTVGTPELCIDGRVERGPQEFIAGPGGVYFRADDGVHGRELWFSDGSAAGTRLVADLNPGSDGAFPAALTATSRGLYFVADDGDGRDLWRTDGTAAGTRRVREIGAGPVPKFVPEAAIGALGERLIFAADDGVHGIEPWISDGSAAGTQLLVDTVAGAADGLDFSYVPYASTNLFFRVGDALVFFAGSPMQVWRTTGTTAGTRMIGTPGRALPHAAAVVGDRLFYLTGRVIGVVSDDAVIEQQPFDVDLQVIDAPLDGGDAAYFRVIVDHQCELWRSDGTADGLQRVVSREVCGNAIGYESSWTARAGTHVLFNGGFGEEEPYVLDATPAGAHMLRDINRSSDRTASTSFPVAAAGAAGDTLLFGVYQDSQTMLWRSDGTSDGTFPLLPLWPAHGTSVDDRFVFVGDRFEDSGIWSSDGTAQGTAMLVPLAGSESVTTAAGADGLFAIVVGEQRGAELWKSDGTLAGTGVLAMLAPAGGPNYEALAPFAGGVAYVTRDFQSGQHVWWLPPGTTEPRRLGSFALLPSIAELVEQGGALYFAAAAIDGDVNLWRSDGSGDAAVQVTHFRGISNGPELRDLTAALGGVLFAYTDRDFAVTPWFRDEIRLSRRVADLRLPGGFFDYVPHRFAALDHAALFVVEDDAHGAALWRTTGEPDGAELVRDIDPRPFARVGSPTVVDGVALFVPDAGIGAEPWRSDGTADGTYPLADIAPGATSSWAGQLGVTARHIFFTADDGQHGIELWALPRAALAPHCVGDCDSDGAVTIDELVRGVGIALEGGAGCVAFDRNGDGATGIAELVGAVGAAQGGCG